MFIPHSDKSILSQSNGPSNLQDFSHASPLFGPYAALLGPVASAVVKRCQEHRHDYIENEYLEELVATNSLGIEIANELPVRELLSNCHLFSILGMIRNARWIGACWREYEAQNFLAWANNTRALIESIADSHFDLIQTAFGIAEHKSAIRSALGGSVSNEFYSFDAFESKIIHFFQARKLSKKEKIALPETYSARPAWEYVRQLERADLTGLYDLYSKLSEVSHPSSVSLSPFYKRHEDGGWIISETQDFMLISSTISDHKRVFDSLVAHAFYPSFYMLRALVKFKTFPLHPELREFDFSIFPKWRELRELIER